jgi:rhamnogalacturonan endolyase
VIRASLKSLEQPEGRPDHGSGGSRRAPKVARRRRSRAVVAARVLPQRHRATIWSHAAVGCDNGRAVAADVYAGSAGAEAWSNAVSTMTSATGGSVGRKPSSQNFLIWWDGDPLRELLDDIRIDKYGTSSDTRLLTGAGVASNNGTKATPGLSGDILGD